MSFICLPPLGKPDPAVAKPEGFDTRPRVLQSGLKDNDAWYRVFNMLRERWKAPNTDGLRERYLERVISQYRKEHSKHERSLPDMADQINVPVVRRHLSSLTKDTIANEGRMLLSIFTRVEEDPSNGIQVKLSSIIPGFLLDEHTENLYDYLVFLKFKKGEQITIEALSGLGKTAAGVFATMIKCDPSFSRNVGSDSWEKLPDSQRRNFSDHLIRLAATEVYGLKVSSWSPRQPIEAMIHELKAHGPLAVGGAFGLPHYLVPPKALGKQVEGREVYGWTKTDPKVPGLVMGNQILIVGAEKQSAERKGIVFYIDPRDASDPAEPGKQRIFAMSYEALTSAERLADNYGFVRQDAPPAVGYALYGPLFAQAKLREDRA